MDAFGQNTLEFQLDWPESQGAYTLEAQLQGSNGRPIRSVREIEVIDPNSFGLAYQKTVAASSCHDIQYLPSNAVDGDISTFWSSSFVDSAWLAVDFGKTNSIHSIHITWENAYSKAYAIQASLDGQSWWDIFTEEDGKGGDNEIKIEPVQARHIRILCSKRGTQWGHAIRELEVF